MFQQALKRIIAQRPAQLEQAYRDEFGISEDAVAHVMSAICNLQRLAIQTVIVEAENSDLVLQMTDFVAVKGGQCYVFSRHKDKRVKSWVQPRYYAACIALKNGSHEADVRVNELRPDYTMAIIFDGILDKNSLLAAFEQWYPKLTPGGLLAGMHYDCEGVRAAVHERFGNNFSVHGAQVWSVEKPKD